MVSLAVNGAMPGEEVKVASGGILRIAARTWAPMAIGAPRMMDIVALGKTLRKVEASGPEQTNSEWR